MNTKMLRLGVIFGYLACFVSLAGNLHAQGLTGTIIGHAYDQSGAVIPGVRVVATNKDTGYSQEAASDNSGFFALAGMPNGVYFVEASAKGFQTLKQGPITLNSTEQLSLDFTLTPGTLQQTIEVQGAAQHLQTQEATVKSQIYLDQVQNLPLNSRSPAELGLLAPSTKVSFQQAPDALQYTINGQNVNGFKLMYDGIEAGIGGDAQYWAGNNFNLSITSVDAIQEYDIATGNYSADIKGSSGYVNFVSKGGTNQIHADVYDFLRNGALDARNFFQSSRGSLKQNDFGSTVGGPIKKDKAFFLVSYEAQRIRAPFPSFTNVPTAAFRATVDPRLKPFLDLTPLPTETIPGNANVGIFRLNVPAILNQNLVTGRTDFNFSAKDRVFVQYTFNDGKLTGQLSTTNQQTIYPGYIQTYPERHQTAAVGWSRTFSPTFLNDLKIGINRFLQGRVRGPINATSFLVPLPSVPGMVIAGGGNKKKLGETQPQLTEKAVWIKGKSTLSFGGNYIFLLTGQNQFSVIAMNFPSLQAFAADAPSSLSSTFGTSLTQRSEHLSWNQVGLFIQEDYRWTPRLTLNVGLRYDNFGVFSDSAHNALNVVKGPFDPFRAPGQPLYNSNNDFGPRFGFAWKPQSKSPLVLRGGFGLFYGTHASGQMGDVLDINNSVPFTLTPADFPDLSYPFSPLLLQKTVATPGRFVLDPNTKDLYTEQWNLTGEYQFGPSTVFTLGYVGNHGVHVPGTQLPNTFDPLLGHRPNTNFGTVRVVANEDSILYNGLQASIRRRLTGNLAFDAYYAWSHSTGLETGTLDVSAAVSFSADQIQTFKNRQLSRGNLPIDFTHNFSADLVYKLPTFASSSGFAKHVLGGWTTSGIFKASTGLPFNITTGGDTGDQLLIQRPNRVPGVALTLSGVSPANGFVNRAAFTTPTVVDPVTGLKLGNLGNNSVRMPPTVTCDWMLAKRLYSAEKWNLDLRSEFFNILNHPVFAFPTANLAAGSLFGKSTGASDPRQIQFMLKISY